MNTKQIGIALSLVATTLIVGCADTTNRSSSSSYPSSSSSSSSYVSYGVIEDIDTIRENDGIGGTGIGAGAVIGGVVGGVLGNQVGSGKGKTAATVVGAAGGAVVGNEIQKRNNANRSDDAYRIRVRLDGGSYMTVTQTDIGDLRVGDQVRVENDTVYRY